MRASLLAMSDEAVELTVAGQTCRVVTSASDDELSALAEMVEDKLAPLLRSGRPVSTQAMLLAAIALANDVREARAHATKVQNHCVQTLSQLHQRVEAALVDPAREPAREAPAKPSKKTAAPTAKKRSKPAARTKSRGQDDEQ
jgi:cell division protein ZapA